MIQPLTPSADASVNHDSFLFTCSLNPVIVYTIYTITALNRPLSFRLPRSGYEGREEVGDGHGHKDVVGRGLHVRSKLLKF